MVFEGEAGRTNALTKLFVEAVKRDVANVVNIQKQILNLVAFVIIEIPASNK